MGHTSRGVLGPTGVGSKTNEISRFRPLLDRLGLTDTVITANALHTQREHADWLVHTVVPLRQVRPCEVGPLQSWDVPRPLGRELSSMGSRWVTCH